MNQLTALVSYQSADLPSAEYLHQEAALRGLRVIRDRVAFLDGRRVQFEMQEAVERADAVISFLTPHSLYLDGQREHRPVLDSEFLPAMQRRRRHLAELAAGYGDTSDVRPVVVPVLFGLGNPRTEGVEIVRKTTGEFIGSMWSPAIAQTGERISQHDAATVARGVLDSLLPAGRGETTDQTSIDLRVQTRGTTSAAPELYIDGTLLLGGDERHPGSPDAWGRFLAGLRDVEEVLRAHSSHRHIKLTPHTHLSGAIAIGRVFHQSSGWKPTVASRVGASTPGKSADTSRLLIGWDPGDEDSRDVTVEIDLLGHPVTELARGFIRDLPRSIRGRLQVAHESDRDLSREQASALADEVARAIRKQVAVVRPRVIHVMMATPADFATFLGHRLTALEAEIQLYERWGDQYVPSLTLPPHLP